MLAIMATTFITLMRLDVRVTANYLDDCRSEMLARGMLNYFTGILRDDLDRTWGKYANRNAQVGIKGWHYGGYVNDRVPGINTYQYGTYLCRDVWFNAPYAGQYWQDDFGGLYNSSALGDRNSVNIQQSFTSTLYTATRFLVRNWDSVNNREYDAYASLNSYYGNPSLVDVDATGRFVSKDYTQGLHPAIGVGVDFDGDGDPWTNSSTSLSDYYYDPAPFVLYAGQTYLFPGERMTGAAGLPGGACWRWGVKLGVAQSCFLNLNSVGNVDGADTAYLANMGNLSADPNRQLHATRSCDEADSDWAAQNDSQHLGRIAWKGFPGEYEYAKGGFPRFYDEVSWHPSQISMERLFTREQYGASPAADPLNLQIARDKARRLIRYRWPSGTINGVPGGKPCDGNDHWRVGWRRDGATYYKFPSPENPMGSDCYFGANEVMEHDHSAWNPQTSAVIRKLTEYGTDHGMSYKDAVTQASKDWRKLKPFVTMWSTDTILRGKIWPTEGWLPWRTNGTPGDWHYMDILKRVNLNMIGAKGPDGIAGEDAALKNVWASKASRERDRLYFMLVAALRFTNTGTEVDATRLDDRRHLACQFIASLIDMIDRDQNETYYQAPDGSVAWALGVEKHPVINEVVFYSGSAANTASYGLNSFRVELYNPMENIPWIPDADEAYDVSNVDGLGHSYVLRIASHNYNLKDLIRYGADPANPNALYVYNPQYSDYVSGLLPGTVKKIGADGMYGYPQPAGTTTHQTWTRYMHLGWQGDWPAGLTKPDLEGASFTGVKVSLWKPLAGDAALKVPLSPGKVELINGVEYICVDATDNLKLVRPYGTANAKINGPGGSLTTYLGIYCRWDPMNAKIYGTQTVNTGSTADSCDPWGNVLWVPGKTLSTYPTLGQPNTNYPVLTSSGNSGAYINYRNAYNTTTPGTYNRMFERDFKVVDGDLPTIGWLGELMMWNCAQNGPLTSVHSAGQQPCTSASGYWTFANALDVTAKFDLFRPFQYPPIGQYNPTGSMCHTENLQVLDIFTVWDPSNDGIDNDGDGAIDDADTGLQAGDKCGPEVQIYGLVDLNQAPQLAVQMMLPDNKYVRGGSLNAGGDLYAGMTAFSADITSSRGTTRMAQALDWGPFETIGDLLRADPIFCSPGVYFSCEKTYYNSNQGGAATIAETGIISAKITNGSVYAPGLTAAADDDGDGIYDERDERDMVFGWASNYFTTRSGIFDIDIVVDTCAPPYYPNQNGTPLKLPLRAYKSNNVFSRKQALGILDRSTCLRVLPNGTCDFSGPVEVRMLRFTDEKKVY